VLVPKPFKSMYKTCQSHSFVHNSLISPASLFQLRCLKLQVSVRFFTSLREIVGKKEETLEFPEGRKVTVETVLETLKQFHGKPFVEYVYDSINGEVCSFLQFLVNGKSATTINGLKTEITDGDVLAILPPVGGG
jgi:MoaD family protein